MVGQNIKILLRIISKNKAQNILNILGLVAGIVVATIGYVYVYYELSFDKFHTDTAKIFKLSAQRKIEGSSINFSAFNYTSADLIKSNLPTLSATTRLYHAERAAILRVPSSTTSIKVKQALFCDSSFLTFFSFHFITPAAKSIMSQPNIVVITEEIAKQLFGKQDPVGALVNIKMWNITQIFKVGAIVESPPQNSSIQFEILLPNQTLSAFERQELLQTSTNFEPGKFETFLKLNLKSDTSTVRRELLALHKSDPESIETSFRLVNIGDLHFDIFSYQGNDTKYFILFPLISILILLLAVVNFISLTTATSTLRAKEVGIKKVVGASKLSLFRQFCLEGFVYTIPAYIIAFIISLIVIPPFFRNFSIPVTSDMLFRPTLLAGLVLAMIATSFMSNLYPSLVLASFDPNHVLVGKLSKKSGGAAIRKVFTVLQFSIAVSLIICVIIMESQLSYIQTLDHTIDKSKILMIPVEKNIQGHYNTVKSELKSITNIEDVAFTQYPLYDGYDILDAQMGNSNIKLSIALITVDTNFINVLGLGWDIRPSNGFTNFPKNEIIINQTAKNELGLNTSISGENNIIKDGDNFITIKGVVKDFSFSSLEYKIKPLGLVIKQPGDSTLFENGGCIYVRMATSSHLNVLLPKINQIIGNFQEESTLNYSILQDAFDKQYQAEKQLASIFTFFVVVTLILGTIGLFGLTIFSIQQRTKEISIRKVLGAGILEITWLLAKEFLLLIGISICVAIPLAAASMSRWLQTFSYRTEIRLWMLLLPAIVSLLVAAVTISFQTTKAILSPPTKGLKTE